MKRKTAALLILVLAFVFISCDGLLTTDESSTTIQATIENTTRVNITNDTEDMLTTLEPTDLTSVIVSTEEPTSELVTIIETTLASTTEVETTIEPTTIVETTIEPTTIENSTTEPTTAIVTTEETSPIVEINLFSINDFHGGAYTDVDMISGIGAYLKNFDGYHLEVSNGDIFQGSALSNYYHGQVLVEALNEGGFDGFVIGNHEFDWGISVIEAYADGDITNGEFTQPILAANIVYEDTQEPLEFTQPYFIQEFDGVKVGVIGLIGNIESSIAASRLDNIVFLDPVEAAATNARLLREDFYVDIVVVYIHNGSSLNSEFAQLSGLERIDAMFNGHTHQNEASSISRSGLNMPYAQMNNYDTSLVSIKLTYDKENEMLIDFDVYGIDNSQLMQSDSDIDAILFEYSSDTVYLDFIEEILTNVEGYYSRYDLATWGASVLRDYTGIDIGAVNAGGFRVSMEPGNLTMGDLITIYPFDNVIKISSMTGQQILDFYKDVQKYSSDVVFDDGLVYNSSTQSLTIGGLAIDLDAYYTVGAVDYIFDKDYYDFLEGENIQQTIYYMRDLLALDLINAVNGFNPDDGSHFE